MKRRLLPPTPPFVRPRERTTGYATRAREGETERYFRLYTTFPFGRIVNSGSSTRPIWEPGGFSDEGDVNLRWWWWWWWWPVARRVDKLGGGRLSTSKNKQNRMDRMGSGTFLPMSTVSK
jgi:hypothetical protein